MKGPLQYLLDTNVVSETRKKHADPRVLAFLSSVDPSALFISVLTLGELRKALAQKQRTDPQTASWIEPWVSGLELSFADRLLGIDSATAKLWGEWSSERPRPVIDTLLAALAKTHELILVTRNTSDLQGLPIEILNPWLT